jgi:hypothetical protein
MQRWRLSVLGSVALGVLVALPAAPAQARCAQARIQISTDRAGKVIGFVDQVHNMGCARAASIGRRSKIFISGRVIAPGGFRCRFITRPRGVIDTTYWRCSNGSARFRLLAFYTTRDPR